MPWSCQEMASTHGIWPQTVLQMTFAGLFRMKDALNSRSGVGQVFDVLQAVNTWQYVLWLSIFFYLASRGRGSGSSRCDVSTVKAAHARSCTRYVQVEQLCASKCASQHQKCSACCSHAHHLTRHANINSLQKAERSNGKRDFHVTEGNS